MNIFFYPAAEGDLAYPVIICFTLAPRAQIFPGFVKK
jgi:hypothetical protein